MNYLKIISFGALIWAVAFIIVSIFIGFKVPSNNPAVNAITVLAVAFTSFLLAKSLKLNSAKEMLKNTVGWLIVGLILDSVATVQFAGWHIFWQWNVIVGYLIIVFLPLLAVKRAEMISQSNEK